MQLELQLFLFQFFQIVLVNAGIELLKHTTQSCEIIIVIFGHRITFFRTLCLRKIDDMVNVFHKNSPVMIERSIVDQSGYDIVQF